MTWVAHIQIKKYYSNMQKHTHTLCDSLSRLTLSLWPKMKKKNKTQTPTHTVSLWVTQYSFILTDLFLPLFTVLYLLFCPVFLLCRATTTECNNCILLLYLTPLSHRQLLIYLHHTFYLSLPPLSLSLSILPANPPPSSLHRFQPSLCVFQSPCSPSVPLSLPIYPSILCHLSGCQ